MWNNFWTVSSVEDALKILAEKKGKAKIIAGGTDLLLELKKSQHSGLDTLIDVSRIDFLEPVWQDAEGMIHIAPNATHNHIVASDLLQKEAFLLSQASFSIGTPQIRNMGTIYGNLVTASPANDTISPLIALDAQLEIRSSSSSRTIALNDFYQGVRKVDLQPDEMVTDLYFKPLEENKRSIFLKFILRKIHAISVVNVAMILEFDNNNVTGAKITLGSVAPTIIHAVNCEQFLTGKELTEENIQKASKLAVEDAAPISDIRSSDAYRNRLVEVLSKQGLEALAKGEERLSFPKDPVLLWGGEPFKPSSVAQPILHTNETPITATINKHETSLNTHQNKTLLKLIREGAGLTGSKLGCGEGECGACTMILDGVPVLSCLIPAPRAHGSEITTIEGVAPSEELHPIQQAYIDEGGVQCGFCTPGFIMSTLKLLEEKPRPTKEEIGFGLAGNICRCTGYYGIISAVEKAAEMMEE